MAGMFRNQQQEVVAPQQQAPQPATAPQSFTNRAVTYLSSDAYKKQMEELMKGPEMIRGREIGPQGSPGQAVGFGNIRTMPSRIMTSDDYQKLVIESLKLAAQQRVTRLSPPRISGLLG
jgi:hypothetical protein